MIGKLMWSAVLLSAIASVGMLCGNRAWAQTSGALPQAVPPTDPGYWTKERMDNARPMELHPPADYKPPRQRSTTSTKENTVGSPESAAEAGRPGTR